MAQTAVADPETATGLQELAARHGLRTASVLPTLPAYVQELWSYRHFIASYANARVSSSLGATRLGRGWQLLMPLLNAVLYYLIFGLVLDQKRQIDNFVSYLCIGVFVFIFTQSTVSTGISSISANLGLIRALHFPRACLPIAVTLIEVQHLIASMSVLVGIVLIFGEPLTLQWLLLLPVLLMQTLFNVGLALTVARLGSTLIDLRQVVPFVMRFWMYGSAALYPVTMFEELLSGWPLAVVETNPLLVYIELVRHALMEGVPLASSALQLWLTGLAWALVAGLGGLIYFWRGEKEYGRG
ncbi:ABC transporter permease [Couchioplanes caeruleus]|uniref:Transport permease protein n=2 Tax=Couchioplanes caeruleus TaxID=56438 RepID=A0A1K0FCG4_9ACTN|nr:ABC transporter permease [Couchioplanes caeruleus]OJF10513.1 ABC transporter [Couchioplanes caeruleus subsp. caeruleus]ROP28598.1 teichoic acid transport system permease protein [Couchioplanes caeruleus]